MLQWNLRSFDELTTKELYDLLALRQEIFVVEQKCLYIDTDFKDQKCLHVLGIQNNKLAAYARILPKDLAYPEAVSFGRVATAAFARRQGVGKKLIQKILDHLAETNNPLPIIISAQQYLEKFYQDFGFETISEPYDEDFIPHIKMKKIF